MHALKLVFHSAAIAAACFALSAHADMLSGIGYVPAGVVTLMQRQQQGWAYIRP